jgi:hypothetical protein
MPTEGLPHPDLVLKADFIKSGCSFRQNSLINNWFTTTVPSSGAKSATMELDNGLPPTRPLLTSMDFAILELASPPTLPFLANPNLVLAYHHAKDTLMLVTHLPSSELHVLRLVTSPALLPTLPMTRLLSPYLSLCSHLTM